MKILIIESMAKGLSLDPRIQGEVVSLAGKLDGEDVQIFIDQGSYEKIVRNVMHWTVKEALKGLGEG